jgi:hypothetical protein
MRKQELVHLHGLLAEVAGYCEREGIDLALERYHAVGTTPMSIDHSKSDHEEAVLALTRVLSAGLGDQTGETVPARVE